MKRLGQCSLHVAKHGTNGWGGPCAHTVTVERNGKLYCTRHDPQRVKKRQAKEHEAERLGKAMQQARERYYAAREAILQSVKDGIDGVSLAEKRETLLQTEAKLTAAREAANAHGKVPRFFYY